MKRKTSLLRRRLLDCRGGETFAHECRTRLSHLSDGGAGPRRPSVGIGTWSHAGRRTVHRHGLVAGLHRASPSTSLDKSAGAGAMDLSISSAPAGRTPRVASGAEYSTPARPPPRDRQALHPTLEAQVTSPPAGTGAGGASRDHCPISSGSGRLARRAGRRHQRTSALAQEVDGLPTARDRIVEQPLLPAVTGR